MTNIDIDTRDATPEEGTMSGEIVRLRTALTKAQAAELTALRAEKDSSAIFAWSAGEPPRHLRGEWFIAKTINRDRVVLTALPDGHSYDYKTADHTYIAANDLTAWMQFPDSDYVSYFTPDLVLREKNERAEKAEAERDALQQAQTYSYIGKDGKSILARDLEDQRDAALARVTVLIELIVRNMVSDLGSADEGLKAVGSLTVVDQIMSARTAAAHKGVEE